MADDTPAAWLEWRAALVGRLSDAVECQRVELLCTYTETTTGAHATEHPGYDPASPGAVALLCDVELDGKRRVFRVIVAEGMYDADEPPSYTPEDEARLLEAREEAIRMRDELLRLRDVVCEEDAASIDRVIGEPAECDYPECETGPACVGCDERKR